MKCPKCGSENVLVQREMVGSKSESTHGFVQNEKRHGLLWWICIGCWWMPFVWMMDICTLGLTRLFRKKSYTAKSFTRTNAKNKTVAICQNCGKSWNV